MEYIYEWIKNFSFSVVIFSAFLNMVASEEYKKYIRFYTGMVMILMLCTPIINLLGMERWWDLEYHRNKYELELEELQIKADYFNEVELNDYISSEYDQESEQ